ncbi:MAG TPA: reverse transcriptase domain-containing protein [Ktedonobacteraceae bacterium]|jgi:group II intron reverse transcriptase/maturase|nr:reverse transcriptase domain-containing protein [Ktedonobacteraceae bacterium]
MQSTDVYLGLLRERGKRGLPLKRVYRQLFNRNLYLTAYGKIYRNAGSTTKGVTDETVDAMSLEKIDGIIQLLRTECYEWQPAKRVYILKRNGKKRPLGLPVWSDKLLAEVIRLILNAFYDGQFSEHSHGFREDRGCHTAFQEIYHTWDGVTWIIEGDISDCFGSLDHDLLVSTLSEKIQDGRFLQLMKKLLDAGYLEDWKFHQTLSGVPQGSIVSPILSNILLDKFDKYVETTLTPQYTRGRKRKPNREYRKLHRQMYKLFKKGQKEAALKIRKRLQKLPSIDPHDSDHRRLKYIRYADDFVLAFTGPKSEAEEIKRQIAAFLREELGLHLSEEKTLITHARTSAARFLGYEITTLHSDAKRSKTKAGIKRRSINGRIGLRIPQAVLAEKRNRYQRGNKAMHRAELLNESDYTIMATYQLEYRGIANYYHCAYNMAELSSLKWVMEQSLTKTLANKHKTTVANIYKKYTTHLNVDGRTYKALQVAVPREGKNPLVATWGAIPLKWEVKTPVEDQPQRQQWNNRSELERRLLAQICEHCGATRLTETIEVHHIRALKDLDRYEGREKPSWVKIMAARRRKTLVLCRTCHQNLHAGRPMQQKRSRSRTGLP